jgi:predicted acetyltransferase
MDYRELPDDHEEAFRSQLRYAFRPEAGPELDDDPPGRPEIFHRRGLYDVSDDVPDEDLEPEDILAVCGYYAFTARIRGEWHPVGGVSAVASPPETRRQGHIARLLDDLHAELRERGTHFAALWPFKYEFYRRFGYAMSNKYAVTTLPPSELTAAAGEPAGRFRPLEADDYEALDEVHREWVDEGLAIRRTEGWWRHRAFEGWRKDPYVYGWEDDDGDLRGYIFYVVEGERDEKLMRVYEAAATDDEAHRQLLRFCRNHDSQVESVALHGPVDDYLLDLLDDPRAAEVEIKPGPMIRIVDVEGALESLASPSEVTGSVTVALEDPRYEWNEGAFELRAEGGRATCEPTDDDPQITTDVGTLTQVATGARSVSAVRRYGWLDAEDDGAAEALDALFPPTDVFLREGF